MTTSTDIVNQAIQTMGGNQSPVTGVAPTFDSSVAGRAAAALYVPTVATVARQKAWDFSRKTVPLAVSGNAPPPPWAQEYLYPVDGVQIWQVLPPNADPFNPVPVNYQEAIATVGGVPVKVIRTNLGNAYVTYNANPPESTWDSLFTEAVVDLLAAKMALAIAGKPDVMAALLEKGAAFETLGEGRAD